MSVTRISDQGRTLLRQALAGRITRLAAAAAVVALVVSSWTKNVAPPAKAASTVVQDEQSPEEAYRSGLDAFQAGNHRAALGPLRYAAGAGIFLAKFYLAELLSDPRHVFADANEAYALYSDLIDGNADVDPSYDYRAHFIARAYVKKGRYLSGTLSAPGIERSEEEARQLFGYAATYLDYPDAQFEFARMLLDGRGGVKNIRSGKHYLSTLSRKGHAGAQGYLAELFWIGKHVQKRPDYALALSTLAVRNSPRQDRLWLDELHHEIYCATSEQTRAAAEKLIARWQQTHPNKRIYPREQNVAALGSDVRWSCADSDGNAVPAIPDPAVINSDQPAPEGSLWTNPATRPSMQGSVMGFSGGDAGEENAVE